METLREQLLLFSRRFELLYASCCDECCGEQVSLAQSQALFAIRRLSSPAMQQVAEELGMDITTFSRQTKALEIKGLVSRCVSPGDRRVTLLSLTSEGLQVLSRIDSYLTKRLGAVITDMTIFERETVVRSLELLNRAVIKLGESTSQQKGTVACCK